VAEEAAQEAFTIAVQQWQSQGIPAFPRAWIIQTACFKAIDRIRRRSHLSEKLEESATSGMVATLQEPKDDPEEIFDDRL
jgi:RNA polymerase sigma-70 factor, ECF subfamily